MSLTQSAEENLQVIRTMLERSSQYRAISVPAAIWCGSLSVIAFIAHFIAVQFGRPLSTCEFFLLWGIVCILAIIGSFLLLLQESRVEKKPIWTESCRAALRGIFPPLFVGFLATVFLIQTGFHEQVYPPIAVEGSNIRQQLKVIVIPSETVHWIFFYGLALLGTQHFAPKSITVLGWTFLLTGCGIQFVPIWFHLGRILAMFSPHENGVLSASLVMALTFGLYHLIYALLVSLSIRRSQKTSINVS